MENIFEKLAAINPHILEKVAEISKEYAAELEFNSIPTQYPAPNPPTPAVETSMLPVLTGAGIGGVTGAALGNYFGNKNNKVITTTLGGLAGAGLGGAAGYYLKQASVLAPTLTAKFAAEQEVEPRKLPKQNKYDLLYYPDVTQHALAAGLTVGAAPMLGLGLPHPAVGLTTGLGVYAGGKLGRGLGAVAGFPNAGALAGEIAGGVGGLVAGKHLM